MPYYDDPTRVQHMLEAASKAVEYCRDRRRTDLDRDELLALGHRKKGP